MRARGHKRQFVSLSHVLVVVFAAMEQAKKTVTKAELAQVSNHAIFERWRVLDLKNLSAEEERSFERDKEISTRIYNSVRAENHLRLAVHAHV